jgi:hypothetical protein
MGVWMLYFNRDALAQRVPMSCDFDRLVPSFSEMMLRAIDNRPPRRDPRSESTGEEG